MSLLLQLNLSSLVQMCCLVVLQMVFLLVSWDILCITPGWETGYVELFGGVGDVGFCHVCV